MKSLRWSFAKVVVVLFLFLNIERLDFGQANIVDIESFVYGLGLVAICTNLLPFVSRLPVSRLLMVWFALFLIFKLFFSARPLIGGMYTYLTLTELLFLLVLVYLSHDLTQELHGFEQAASYVVLANTGQHLPQVEEAEARIRREMTRSRHYHRALSVIVLEPEQKSLEMAIPRLVEEVQAIIGERYAAVRLAETITEELRVVDTVLEDRENGRFVILCPEIEGQEAKVMMERIRKLLAGRFWVQVRYGTASFPNEALTFEALMTAAAEKIKAPEAALPADSPMSASQEVWPANS